MIKPKGWNWKKAAGIRPGKGEMDFRKEVD